MQLMEPKTRRWTRDEFYQMADLGWFRGKRAVLLDGEIIETSPQGSLHSWVLGKVEHVLEDVFPRPTYWVRSQRPLDLPEGSSDPEPDASVVLGKPENYPEHPQTALLVVVVSDSSLKLDRRKANAYASANVPEYWIINLPDHVVEVYRDPIADSTAEFGYRYGSLATLRAGQGVHPVSAPRQQVAVTDLLPAQPVGDAL